MASHPYISGPGNITQMVGFLKKNFPATVNAETVRKLNLAPNNESYVINVLQFIGLIGEDGKRTDIGHEVMTTHNEDAFKAAFAELVRKAYSDLFALRGEDAWSLSKNELMGYFRSADKTSEAIGARQAGVFLALSELSGFQPTAAAATAKPKAAASKSTTRAAKKPAAAKHTPPAATEPIADPIKSKSDMALTVRIEINLPAEGSRETYDAIFQSIKANLYP